MAVALPPLDHDPELTRLLDRVVALAAARPLTEPDELMEQAQALEVDFAELARFRSDAALERALLAFADKSFRLIDEGREYAEVGHELLLLAVVLGEHAARAAPALQHGVRELVGVMAEPGVVEVFGMLLKRLRALARASGNEELFGWVRAVVHALPGADEPPKG